MVRKFPLLKATAAVFCTVLTVGCVPSVSTLVITTTTSNPACDGSGVTSGSGAFSLGGSGGCITSVSSALESKANAIRNSDQYTYQTTTHGVGGSTIRSNSLIAGGFEYAHALDLTGAEQIIAIHDAGFNPTHLELLDKSIAYGHGTTEATITRDSHGTAVAGLAAGSAKWGRTIGAAPNASLYFSSWADGADHVSVTDAESLGAIALNNSWSYICSGDLFDECGINDYSTSFISSTHRNAFLNYAGDEGIVVFSASNEETQTQATYMAALPVLIPVLEEGWLAVINVARDYDTSEPDLFDDTNIGLMSSGCLEAARWCVAADGTSYIAATKSDKYELGTGTSYATPRVSGAIAILAEAFPNLSTKEIRNRLLMTADNAFFAADTTQIQTLNFQGGLSHDYHWVYGHGFIDLKSALLPIGGATTTAKGLVINISSPAIHSIGASGDAVQTALSKHTLHSTDAMGGEFNIRGDALAATHTDMGRAQQNLAILAAFGLPNSVVASSPFDQQAGIELPFELTSNTEMDLKLPTSDIGPIAIKLATRTPIQKGSLMLGVSVQEDNSSLLGLSVGDYGSLNSMQLGIQAAYSIDLNDTQSFELAGHTGNARTQTSGFFDDIEDVSFAGFGVKFSQADTLSTGDLFSIYANQPTAITSGSAHMTLNLSSTGGTAQSTQINLPLSPTARETEIGVEYSAQGFSGSSWIVQASTRLNASNIANNDIGNLLLGVRKQF
ncbi:MAG: S8 family serine peptidase [Paracoccaceae bacterium]|nr:S8 family serine peptidase [Paracoccaceae bacterium]MDG2260134.1 S8 family serine peptidase [Paracoccaceae bacterium]